MPQPKADAPPAQKNLEFKAKVRHPAQLEEAFIREGAFFIEILEQRDTYFSVPRGRLKLREIGGKRTELIFYERDETSPGGMQSFYDVVGAADPGLKEVLSKALGVKVVVSKKRRLLMLRNARIHLDEVETLGSYLEFEVMSRGDDAGDAALLTSLKEVAAPFVEKEIGVSYSDLIAAGQINT